MQDEKRVNLMIGQDDKGRSMTQLICDNSQLDVAEDVMLLSKKVLKKFIGAKQVKCTKIEEGDNVTLYIDNKEIAKIIIPL